MSNKSYKAAGDLFAEIKDSSLESITGAAQPQKIFTFLSKDNTGKYCTLTWECAICPTLTCFC